MITAPPVAAVTAIPKETAPMVTASPVVVQTETPTPTQPVKTPTITPTLTPLESLTPQPDGQVLYSGSYENTTWTLDSNGLLEVTGATDLSFMFWNCSNLVDVDLSGLDTLKVRDTNKMFYECSNLNTIHTPKRTSTIVPDLPSEIWNGSDGITYMKLPEDAVESITLTKSES